MCVWQFSLRLLGHGSYGILAAEELIMSPVQINLVICTSRVISYILSLNVDQVQLSFNGKLKLLILSDQIFVHIVGRLLIPPE